jgi:hypothetical protein
VEQATYGEECLLHRSSARVLTTGEASLAQHAARRYPDLGTAERSSGRLDRATRRSSVLTPDPPGQAFCGRDVALDTPALPRSTLKEPNGRSRAATTGTRRRPGSHPVTDSARGLTVQRLNRPAGTWKAGSPSLLPTRTATGHLRPPLTTAGTGLGDIAGPNYALTTTVAMQHGGARTSTSVARRHTAEAADWPPDKRASSKRPTLCT